VRYPFSAGITAELTLNPDFSQVESDAAQIDVNTTFALFFPERRPFFQEGSDLFTSYFDVFYSRQINDPIVAAKLVGRLRRTTFAYLTAVDERSALLVPLEERSFIGQAGRSFSNVARVRRAILRDSYVGAILADRRFHGNGGSGTTGGIDGRIRFLRNYFLAYQILVSYTQEPNDSTLTEGINDRRFDRGRHTAAFDGESYWGHAQFVRLARGARLWEFSINYWALSPTFRADVGYEGQNDMRLFRVFQRLNFYPGSWLLDHLSPKLLLWRRWNFDGVRKEDMVAPSIEITFRGDIHLAFEYVYSRELFSNIRFDNLKAWSISLRAGFSEVFRPGFSLNHGRWIQRFEDPPVSGIGTDAEVWFEFRPFTRWTIEPRLQYSRLENEETGQEFFEGYILRARTMFQFSRELSFRLIIQYNDFSQALSIEPLLTYKLNPFTMFYVGSRQLYEQHDDPGGFTHTSRQFFAKFQYLVQL
jgi:hypothetical protein